MCYIHQKQYEMAFLCNPITLEFLINILDQINTLLDEFIKVTQRTDPNKHTDDNFFVSTISRTGTNKNIFMGKIAKSQ